MKKSLFLAAILGILAMTACEKENNTSGDTPSRHGTPCMEYKVCINDTILHFYDVTIQYRDADKATQTEVMTSKEWGKKFDSFGDSLSLRVSFALRSDADTTYANNPWLKNANSDPSVMLNYSFYASAYSAPYQKDAKYYGDLPGTKDRSSGAMKLNHFHWSGVTNRLNQVGDYKHLAIGNL